MALTKVSPSLFQVSNNITSVTVGGSANTISLTFDSNGVITGASNNAVSVANTAITGNIISSQIASVSGSAITANTVANSAFQTGSVENYLNASGGSLSGRNRIINGAMMIDQRNAGSSLTPTNGQYTLDRWIAYMAASAKFSVQQDTSANTVAGFTSSMKITSLSAYSVGSADEFNINQAIEGFNFGDLRWGTANAAPITVSFWVRSSLTGTHGGCVRSYDISRSYPFSYTIVAANTWEKKTITVPGDTSGTWVGLSNAGAVWLTFGLGTGSTLSNTAGAWVAGNYTNATGAVSLVGTNGATWYVTGVQIEKGSQATPFEYCQYGTELALCQRYYEVLTNPYGLAMSCFNSTDAYANLVYTQKRATPGVSLGSVGSFYSAGAARTLSSITAQNITQNNLQFKVTGSGFTGGNAGHYDFNGNFTISAEL